MKGKISFPWVFFTLASVLFAAFVTVWIFYIDWAPFRSAIALGVASMFLFLVVVAALVISALLLVSGQTLLKRVDGWVIIFLRISIVIFLSISSLYFLTMTLHSLGVGRTDFKEQAVPTEQLGGISSQGKTQKNLVAGAVVAERGLPDDKPDMNSLEMMSALALFGGLLAYVFKVIVRQDILDENGRLNKVLTEENNKLSIKLMEENSKLSIKLTEESNKFKEALEKKYENLTRESQEFVLASIDNVLSLTLYGRFLVHTEECHVEANSKNPCKKLPEELLFIIDSAISVVKRGIKKIEENRGKEDERAQEKGFFKEEMLCALKNNYAWFYVQRFRMVEKIENAERKEEEIVSCKMIWPVVLEHAKYAYDRGDRYGDKRLKNWGETYESAKDIKKKLQPE